MHRCKKEGNKIKEGVGTTTFYLRAIFFSSTLSRCCCFLYKSWAKQIVEGCVTQMQIKYHAKHITIPYFKYFLNN